MLEYSNTIRIDENDPRILHLEWCNESNVPQSSTPGSALLVDTKKVPANFKLYMVTRRSSVNPGEKVKLRLELESPVTDYPPKACLSIGLVSYSELTPRINFALRNATN